jgi:type I restriction enzyme, S subunit
MGWEKVKLGELIENFSVKGKTIDGYENLPFYGVSNKVGITISKYAAEDKADDYKVLEEGCFAYNPYRVNVGSIAYLDSDDQGLISPAYVVFKTREKSIVPELLLKFLKSKEGLRQIKLHARGTVRQALRFEDLCKIELNLPDFIEQLDFFTSFQKKEEGANNLIEEQSHQFTLLKKLRQQILQDAVMGKLVEQDPDDEPASVLLGRIAEEKQKLIAEGKIKKGKPLPEIAEENKPFEILSSWEWCRLGKLAIYSEAGKSYKALETQASEEEFGVIKTSAITTSLFIESENKKLPIQNDPYYEKITIAEGDLLFCRASGSKGLAGKSCIVLQKPKPKLVLSDKSIRYETPLVISKKFIQRYNESAFAGDYYLKLGTAKSTSMNNITRLEFDKLCIPLPPLNEQHRIVAKVEQLMKICDDLELSIQQNQKYTQELLQVVLKEALEPN